MSSFDAATSLVPRGDGVTFDATVDAGWTIGPERPNGGYLLALLGRGAIEAAAAAGATHPHALAATAQYVTAARPGPAVVRAETLRVGRSASQVRVALEVDDQVCVQTVITLGRLHEAASPWWGGLEPPALPPEEECERLARMPDAAATGPTIRDQVHTRFDPACLGFFSGRPTGQAELRAWLRFADGRQPDPLALLYAVDALFPVTFELGTVGWVPTLQLTAMVRA
ncbi:MAG TPA: thioesterase family protein, partial [Acidimicrobiales bacterium]|nr:thioesterase family protein [Acidimicrobiales bacterium]